MQDYRPLQSSFIGKSYFVTIHINMYYTTLLCVPVSYQYKGSTKGCSC